MSAAQFAAAVARREEALAVNERLDALLYGPDEAARLAQQARASWDLGTGAYREQNPVWAPIAPAPAPLWSTTAEVIAAYQRAERPVRVARSQRYSLTVTEALPEPTWRKP